MTAGELLLAIMANSGLTAEESTKLLGLPQATENATAVWADPSATALIEEIHFIERAIHVDTELLVQGIGTQESPFNTLEATLDHMEARGLRLLHVLSDITLDRNVKNFLIRGIGLPAIDCNGQNLDRSRFDHCTMKGDYIGSITVQECALADGFTLNGYFEVCAVLGDLYSAPLAAIDLIDCVSGIRGLAYPTLHSMDGTVSVRGFKGSLGISGCTGGEHSIGLSEGRLLASNTCTGGHLHVRGTPFAIVDDSQAGCLLFDETDSSKTRELHEASYNRRVHNDVDNTITIYEGDKVTPKKVFDTNTDLSDITPR